MYRQKMIQQQLIVFAIAFLTSFHSLEACKCYVPPEEPVQEVVLTKPPSQYLKSSDLPAVWDWRNINGTNYCSKVLTQQSPNVCGSCWAEAATGALTDRYTIATGGKLRMNLAPQQLLNFNKRITGGSCNGGSDLKAYEFMHKYGISDDTCAAFIGLDWIRGFDVAAKVDVEDVQKHQCFQCLWEGTCTFVQRDKFDLYGVDEYGSVKGVDAMKAEIYARGPIACLINSDPPQFNSYRGGIISCDRTLEKGCHSPLTDHVIVIAGWGKDAKTGTEYWVGRNSYGTQWGEGAGGGWFRVELGKDTLNIESGGCSWGVPAKADVDRAVKQFDDALGL